MFSARFFILIVSVFELVYKIIKTKITDIQRKKPLPAEVADVYDAERYQTYLNYTADENKIRTKYRIIDIVMNIILIFSPMYKYIEAWCNKNPYLILLLTFAIIWFVSTIVDVIGSYEVTFGIMQKYGMNRKDRKEWAKDEIIQGIFEVVLTLGLSELIAFIGEHIAGWTNNFSVGVVKSIVVCLAIFAVVYLFITLIKPISYLVLKKKYTFTPLEEGELRDKIYKLQEGCKKKVTHIYVYNESKKTTFKNAFLLKLFWHREFGIADNFINENAEDELLAVLSHEIGHLKHKKNILNILGYVSTALEGIAIIYLVINPSIIFSIIDWINKSFDITVISYYIFVTIIMDIVKPISFADKVFDSYRLKQEEYEADREAVKNGYAEALIKTFKNLSSDELINVNPHPFIEFTEYNHPGMYQRIKAINEAEQKNRSNEKLSSSKTSKKDFDNVLANGRNEK